MSTAQGTDEGQALPRKFMPLEGVQEILSISRSQAYALVRSGELRAIQVGGRNQWRVSESELEAYIEHAYASTAKELGISPPPRAST